jgi:hypothetical protein
MRKVLISICIIAQLLMSCAVMNIHILNNNAIPSKESLKLGLAILEPNLHSGPRNPIDQCFGEPNSDKTYCLYLSSLLARTIPSKTMFSSAEIVLDSISLKESYPKWNDDFLQVPSDTITKYDYLLLIDEIWVEFNPAHYESGSNNAYGTKTSGFEHLPGKFCETANVSLVNCHTNHIYEYGYIYSCVVTQMLSKGDLYVFANRLVDELFGKANLLKKS